jgi:hypothetical protein
VPPCAAEFAIGRKLEADFFLLFDDLLDLAVFNRLERRSVDLTLGMLGTRILQRQPCAADCRRDPLERWRGARAHFPQTSSDNSTTMRSFAHCSSSASTLPSSVEAKPHCGDRQS